MTLEAVVTDSVRGLGFDLVELERLPGGLLRVTVDHPWQPDVPTPSISVDDCERVSNQLQYVLEVEGVDYQRLEVSSPGIDRLLRDANDLARFVGERIELHFRAPLLRDGAEGRKKLCGVLGPATPEGWHIAWSPSTARARGGRAARKRTAEPTRDLVFTLDELVSARLAPLLDFKPRNRGKADAAAADEV